MTLTRPFPRAFTCAGIFCGYAVPYVWMDEPGRIWPILRTLLAAVFAAAFVGMIAARFGWPLRWWQFAAAVLFVQVVVACALEFGVQHVRPPSMRVREAPHHIVTPISSSRFPAPFPNGEKYSSPG